MTKKKLGLLLNLLSRKTISKIHKKLFMKIYNLFILTKLITKNNLPQNTVDPISYVTTNPHSMFLSLLTESGCNNLIMTLKITKQTINFIPVKVLKEFRSFTPPTLCDIMNTSFSSGIFPKLFRCLLVASHTK